MALFTSYLTPEEAALRRYAWGLVGDLPGLELGLPLFWFTVIIIFCSYSVFNSLLAPYSFVHYSYLFLDIIFVLFFLHWPLWTD